MTKSSIFFFIFYMIYLLLLLCAFVSSAKKEDYFHVPPTDAIVEKLKYPGWQEPGLWRPKWYLYRRLIDENDDSKIKLERLCIKLNSDRTIKIFRPEYRRLIDWRDPQIATEETNLSDSPNLESRPEDVISSKDGTWWWQDNKDGTGSLKLEMKNKLAGKRKMINEDGETVVEEEDLGLKNILIHETMISYGRILDPYAIYVEDGFVSAYKDQRGKTGLPVGTNKIGFFSMRANAHRPLISKDFQAFQ